MKVYATTDDGERVLVRIECDHAGCSASVKPHADIASTGWTKHGYLDVFDERHEFAYCPAHALTPKGSIGSDRQDTLARRLLDFERFKRKMAARR